MAKTPQTQHPDAAAFLARHPPFDSLERAEVEQIASTVALREYRVGDVALVEDGKPSEAFYVIRDGSMELVHEEEVIDILEPGEGFGHPSLLTGLAPTFTVRASRVPPRTSSRGLFFSRRYSSVAATPAAITISSTTLFTMADFFATNPSMAPQIEERVDVVIQRIRRRYVQNLVEKDV